MVWDFVELNPLGGMGEPFDFVDKIASLLERSLCLGTEGWATQQDAAQSLPGCGPLFVCTDPPYYDNIGYADLADFFYAWLSLSPLKERQASFATITSPKSSEMIASKYRHEGSSEQAQAFFDTSMQKFASQLSQRQEPAVPSTIFYAFKQSVTDGTGTSSSGWETFLGGLIAAGGMVTATWPMRTERKDRVLGIGANALASSIVLACRSRPAEAGTSTRGDFVKQLRRNLGFAIADLQRSSIAPVDLRQAAIGPGMAVFSRYKQVVESDGSPMSVRDALKLINAELDEILTEQDADYDSITRFAAVWFEQHGFAAGDYGTAQTLATAQNISVESVVEAGVLEAKAGKVRLLRIDELDADWEPETDDTPTVWEMTHHLCRRYDDGGERAAADLIRRLDHHADAAQALAYRLYLVCEKEKWSEDGQSYNRLGTAWNDLARLALDPDIAAAEAGSNDAGDDATLYNDA